MKGAGNFVQARVPVPGLFGVSHIKAVWAPENLMTLYFVFIMFEWVLWKWVPLPYQGISLCRIALDGAFFLAMGATAVTSGGRIRQLGRSLILTFLIILLVATISTVYQQTSVMFIVNSVFAVFRYSVILLIPSPRWSTRFQRLLFRVFWVQVAIGLIEASGVIPVRTLLLPTADRWLVLVDKGLPAALREGFGGISSTFLNTVDYSFYLIISYLMLYWGTQNAKKWLVALLVVILIIYTQSLASLIVFCLMLLLDVKKKGLKSALVATAVTPLIVLTIVYFDAIRTYLEITLYFSRLGFFVNLLPSFFADHLFYILFGVGLDPVASLGVIKHYPVIPQMLIDENSLANLKDVFWIAQLFQWGMVGLSAFAWFMLQIKRIEKSKLINTLLLFVLLLGFTNQVLEIKTFSYLFWVMVLFSANIEVAKNSGWLRI